MNFRLAEPAVLVDLNRIDELAGIEETPAGGLTIGAMTRQRSLERSPAVAARAPLLAQTIPWIAHPQIRNRGTIGGSAAHADPAAEIPAALTALGARLRAVSHAAPAGRWIDAADFFIGLFETALEPGELLAEIEIPGAAPRSGAAFVEIARRRGDYALVGVATVVALDAAGRFADARIALLSVGDSPVTAAEAAERLRGETPDEALFDDAARLAAEAIDPPGDIHASPDYRRHLTRVLVRRALGAAAGRAVDGE